ncbi:gastrula zinc finger protein XlCGF49.1-like [Polypterus senegalus]|uniref:gastrula zinc finger protein XlCGF49.1-like n=1 Tax=Polypterus senegalus TaxID=55291 RepID=UPI00196590D8|nr:gastrula zinc finger protein XlCGF49.1-like [Polypterus senegalus]
MFRQKYQLQKHKKSYRDLKPYTCGECQRDFRLLQTTPWVPLKALYGEKAFCCSECRKRFSLSMREFITKSISSPALTVGKAFTMRTASGNVWRSTLVRQTTAVLNAGKGLQREHTSGHTGKGVYYCTECGKSFIKKTQLNDHQKIHTGEKPYSCKYCEKTFTQKVILHRHQKTHTGEKVFCCTDCGKWLSKSKNPQWHRKFHARYWPLCCTVYKTFQAKGSGSDSPETSEENDCVEFGQIFTEKRNFGNTSKFT